MNWTLGGVRIFTKESMEEGGQIIARVQPLSGGTIDQVFGYESPSRKLSCLIVGAADKASLLTMTTTGTTYVLQSPEGSLGNFLVQKVTFSRIPSVAQTLRTDLACDDQVFQCEISLFKEA